MDQDQMVRCQRSAQRRQRFENRSIIRNKDLNDLGGFPYLCWLTHKIWFDLRRPIPHIDLESFLSQILGDPRSYDPEPNYANSNWSTHERNLRGLIRVSRCSFESGRVNP